MSSHPRPPLRHCPICGVAMQASKSHEEAADFDIFQCLSCNTTIDKQKRDTPGKD